LSYFQVHKLKHSHHYRRAAAARHAARHALDQSEEDVNLGSSSATAMNMLDQTDISMDLRNTADSPLYVQVTPQPSTLNPQPSTLNPQPSTFNLKVPATPNPKP
jgi:hypothetical protein